MSIDVLFFLLLLLLCLCKPPRALLCFYKLTFIVEEELFGRRRSRDQMWQMCSHYKVAFSSSSSVPVVFDVYRDSQVSTLMTSGCHCLQIVLPSPGSVHSQGRVWLIDLNPFGEVTDSLLFSWEELTSGEITQQQVSHHLTQTKDVVV